MLQGHATLVEVLDVAKERLKVDDVDLLGLQPSRGREVLLHKPGLLPQRACRLQNLRTWLLQNLLFDLIGLLSDEVVLELALKGDRLREEAPAGWSRLLLLAALDSTCEKVVLIQPFCALSESRDQAVAQPLWRRLLRACRLVEDRVLVAGHLLEADQAVIEVEDGLKARVVTVVRLKVGGLVCGVARVARPAIREEVRDHVENVDLQEQLEAPHVDVDDFSTVGLLLDAHDEVSRIGLKVVGPGLGLGEGVAMQAGVIVEGPGGPNGSR